MLVWLRVPATATIDGSMVFSHQEFWGVSPERLSAAMFIPEVVGVLSPLEQEFHLVFEPFLDLTTVYSVVTIISL